jgi:SH3-like domain-containing protein
MRVLVWIICCLSGLAACHHGGTGDLQQQAGEIAAKYAPDRRTGIAEVVLTPAGKGKILVQGETLYPEARAEILELVRAAGYRATDSMKLLPEPGCPGPWGLVAVSVANIRSKASHSSELTTQAVMGTPVRIVRERKGWFEIQTPDQYLGWTTSSSLEIVDENRLEEWKRAPRLLFTEICGQITIQPGKSAAVSDLVAGSVVVLKSGSSTHYELLLPDGRTGFSPKNGFVEFQEWKDTVKATPEGICHTAEMFTGLPYMWGGTSSKALDCSGFTRSVYFLNGIILERDASQQIMHGQNVSPENHFAGLQKGDLLFYGSKEPFRVVHVGIWQGNAGVIHASGMVKTESMEPGSDHFSSYLHDTFLDEVRRIAGYSGSTGIVHIRDHPWY